MSVAFDQMQQDIPTATTLKAEQEKAYRQWIDKIGQGPGSGYNIDPSYTGTDYDYRGFFKKYGAKDIKKGQHFTDEFKLPNHPTFSVESRYAVGINRSKAGRWEGDRYIPAGSSSMPDQMPGLDQQNQPAAQPVPPGASPPLPGTTDPLAQFKGDIAGISALDTQAAGAQAGQASQIQSMQPPQRDTAVYDMMPFLLGMTALGGKATGLHSRVMLGALNGMVKGTLMGNQQQFEDSFQKYQENKQKLLQLFALQNQYYATLRDAYKDRADADYKAAELARRMTNDEWQHEYRDQLAQQKQGMDELKSYTMLQNLQRQWADHDERVRWDDMRNQIQQLQAQIAGRRVDVQAARVAQTGQAKVKEHAQQVSRADQLIDEIIGIAQQSKGKTLGVTGASGMVSRVIETGENIAGMSTDTTAHDFQSKLSELHLLLPKLLTNSSKSAKEERAMVETIARGLKLGDTPENTISSARQLKRSISNLPPDTGDGREVTRTGTLNGRKVVQYSDGTVEYAEQSTQPQ